MEAKAARSSGSRGAVQEDRRRGGKEADAGRGASCATAPLLGGGGFTGSAKKIGRH